MNHNASAFPYSALCPEGPQIYADDTGLTKREWFAGLAMQALLSRPSRGELDKTIKGAVEIADALLKALDK